MFLEGPLCDVPLEQTCTHMKVLSRAGTNYGPRSSSGRRVEEETVS